MKRFLSLSLLAVSGITAAYEPEQGNFDENRALYAHYSQDYLTAALITLTENTGNLNERNQRFLAENLLSYGLYQPALRQFRALLKDGDLSSSERAAIWLKIARFEYERGYLDEAETTLTEMRVDVGARRERTERNLLMGQIQLRQGRIDAAIDTLRDGRTFAKDQYARFNLAVALMQAGEVRRARHELDTIGRQIVTDPFEHALRDRANLALGYNYLAEAKGASALPALKRIRLEGPYSDEALLGMGWAEIAADKADEIRLTNQDTPDTISGIAGVIIRSGRVGDDLRERLGMLPALASRENAEQRFQRALIPWLELDSRDPKKPAVLEVQLAIPYALDSLGEHRRARVFYKRAVQRLEESRNGVEKAIDGIRSGRMIETMIARERDREAGWEWRLRDLPNAPETYYLAEVLAESQFQEALKNYRDLRQMQRQLARKLALLGQIQSGEHRLSVPAEQLFRQARDNADPLWGQQKIDLQLETRLGRFARNETLEGLLAWTYRYAPKIALQVAGTPPRFGAVDVPVVGNLNARTENLLEQVNGLLGQQRELLEQIAVGEMETHKAQLTRYLIDARFALARIFDQPGSKDDEE